MLQRRAGIVLCILRAFTNITKRRTAESTYAKKKMYYNMKFKTLKRGINGQMKNAAQARDEHEGQVFTHMEPLYREMCELQRIKEENAYNITPVVAVSATGEEVPRPTVEECDQKLAVLRKFEADQLAYVANIEVQLSHLLIIVIFV